MFCRHFLNENPEQDRISFFSAVPDKMPEHPLTCYRVQVGITPQRIVRDSTVKIVVNPDTAGELVRVVGF